MNINFNPINLTNNIKNITYIRWLAIATTVILFIASSLKHFLYRSTALDLGWFDQATYLISQGLTPIVSFAGSSGVHILGDHAALIFYPLALLYKIYPSVYWLFLVQAIGLSAGAIAIWHLAENSGLSKTQSNTIATAYILYPLIFNVNLFDFHPETLAPVLIFWSIVAARKNNVILFSAIILFILSLKAVLSLTIAAMGLWLVLFEKKRVCGAIALIAAISWFLIATQVVIPYFNPDGVAAVGRYRGLGSSPLEIAKNILLQPSLLLERLLNLSNLEYICLLLIPIIWGLYPKYLAPLACTVPALLMNLLTEYTAQKDLIHQYSLPILPFLWVAIIGAIAHRRTWIINRNKMILWSFISFVLLAKYGYFWSLYLQELDTWSATRTVVEKVNNKSGVMATAQIVPHLTHRAIVKLATEGAENSDFRDINFVILNMRHPGWNSSLETSLKIKQGLEKIPEFQINYQKDEVYLFEKKTN